ncbi:YopX protein [Staphylococcus gallinarum]|uniref:YopX protein n=1 Tax=Staphylococcus gallinarum TaxID=1293 RepID=A0A380FFA2_STAGA|nr:YopX protein [Staphylococcus gallinarum]
MMIAFQLDFDHMEDLDIINKNGSIDRTVMMSTGLKDKHGKEIYDKDIVQDSYGDVYLIKWLDGGFVLTEFYNGGYDHYIINDFKIIRNYR